MIIKNFGQYSVHKTVDVDYGGVTFYEVRNQFGGLVNEYSTHEMSDTEAREKALSQAQFIQNGVIRA